MRVKWISLIVALAAATAAAACASATAQPTPVPPKPAAGEVKPTAAPAQPTAVATKAAGAAAAPAQPTATKPATAAPPSQALINAAKAEGEVVLLGSFQTEWFQFLADEFPKKYGIKVNWTRKGGPEVQAQIDAERRTGKMRVDVVAAGSPASSRMYAAQGISEKYQPESAALLVPSMRDPLGLYVPYSAELLPMLYGTSRVKKEDLPKTWKDLTDPRWKDRLGSVRIRGTGSGTSWAQVLHSTYDWPFFEGLARNKPMLISSVSALAPLVLKGEVDIIYPGSEAANMLLIKQGEPVAFHYPTDVVPSRESIAVLTKDGPHPNAGKLLLDYMLREEVQTFVARQLGARTTMAGGPPTEGLASAGTMNLKGDDIDWLEKHQGELWDKFDDIFGFQRSQK